MKNYNLATLKVDANAGLTVALVLVPQSMANAQLAGLPAYHGIYAALLPAFVGGIWGSSRQMVTGSVAVVSLMAAAALQNLPIDGVSGYIAYMALLTLIVGLVQLLLGVLRMGIVVNFLSLPVIAGFTNAAAIIIASSQLAKLFGVTVDAAPHQFETVIAVFASAWNYTHFPSLFMAIFALSIIIATKKYFPRSPGVLIAVILTTCLSWLFGFEQTVKAPVSAITDPETRILLTHLSRQDSEVKTLQKEINRLEREIVENPITALDLGYKIDEHKLVQEHLHRNMSLVKEHLRQTLFSSEEKKDGTRTFTIKHTPALIPNSSTIKPTQPFAFLPFRSSKNAVEQSAQSNGTLPLDTNATRQAEQASSAEPFAQPYMVYETTLPAEPFTDGKTWRLRIGTSAPSLDAVTFTSGGEVVGAMPSSLPSFHLPQFSFSNWLSLLPQALIIAFIGFAEACSIGKITASRGKYRLDANQELVGQGLANIAGAFTLTSPVSGSFSNSAVNLAAGAKTGISCVFASLGALLTLLFFTGPLAYLPQPVLAVIVIRAVVNLFDFSEFKHIWTARWFDGVIACVTFITTLYFAPSLDIAIGIGVALSLVAFFYRSMTPIISTLSCGPDKMLRDTKLFQLEECRHISIVHFQGPLFFANAHILEDFILSRLETQKELCHIHFVCSGITDIDASGEDTLSSLVQRAQKAGVQISFSGVLGSVGDVLARTGLITQVGINNIFSTPREAICVIRPNVQHDAKCEYCPLAHLVCQPNEFRTALERLNAS